MSTGDTVIPAAAKRMRIPQNVVYRPFATETVVLNLDTGKYHGLNPTAGHMVELLDRMGDVGAVVEQLAEEYGQPVARVEQDLRELCRDLMERGLIEVDADPGG